MMYSVDTTNQFEISLQEAERGEVIHYESLEDLKREIG